MRNFYVLLIAFLAVQAQAQYTAIPDVHFEQRLIDIGYDNIIDHRVLTANVSGAPFLSIGPYAVSDLTGIEAFTSITMLDVSGNLLTNLDLPALPNLTLIYCSGNQITNLNVRRLANLQQLHCSHNPMTSIDLSGLDNLMVLEASFTGLTSINLSGLDNLREIYVEDSNLSTATLSNLPNLWLATLLTNNLTAITINGLPNLRYFFVAVNQLATIDVSGLSSLQLLFCDQNQLTSLDVSGLAQLGSLRCQDNPSLYCIKVDDPAAANENPAFEKDAFAVFSSDPIITYYRDADGDGFGTPLISVSSCAMPAGYVANNSDCNDNLKTYADADGDGYGSAAFSACGSIINNTDCDDANANTNPNHVEIPGNGIDDNCDGTADEAGPAIGMIPTQCGTTMSNIANTLYCQQAAAAQGYRFEVTNGVNVRTYDSATNILSLLQLTGGAAYATTYSIRVAVKTNGFYRTYSGSCNITTPAAPATTVVIASQCGTTLANIANLIYCNQVTAASQYRFEVSDGITAARTFDTPVNRFSLTNLSGGATHGVTYSVRVALRFGATWEPYGTACNITTPATPGLTNLIASQCGITISNRWATLYANQVPDAQGYRFEVTNGATVRYYNAAFSRFALGNLIGAVPAETVYTVRVAVLYNSVYGDFGPACTVTTSAAFARQANTSVTEFDVKTYPNPFAATFKLEINTSSEELVAVKVYDIIGKLVESQELNPMELGTQELGSRYSSGVYNVIVSQGENVKTLRIIKR